MDLMSEPGNIEKGMDGWLALLLNLGEVSDIMLD